MTTGERIRAARKRAGLTQKQLGEKLSLSYQTIAQWENGFRNPKFETLDRIASALDVPVVFLLDGIAEDSYYAGFDLATALEKGEQQYFDALQNDLGETAFLLRDLGGQAENMLRTGGLPMKGEMLFSGKNPEFERALAKVISGKAEDKKTIERLLTAFNKLDFWGQQIAVELVETLSNNPSFQRKDQQKVNDQQENPKEETTE